jgi:hypothetical protein
MTIFFPDLSSHQANLKLEPQTAAVVAKATEGTTYYDPEYWNFRGQAEAEKSIFMAYHFLWSGTPAEAATAHHRVGSTPLMIDAENMNVKTTVSMILSFVNNYRKLGGVVHMVYLPRWYWQGHLGSPDLRPLAKAGLSLVSSNYTTYSDNGPGWAPYGGVTPAVWQYSDNFHYGAGSTATGVDFNAFKGTVAQFERLITTGSINPAPVPPPQPPKPTPQPPVPAHTPMTAGMFVEAMRAIATGKEAGPWTQANYPDLIKKK